MSDSGLRLVLKRLYQSLMLFSVLSGITIGCYVIYASLLGDPVFGLVGDPRYGLGGLWWALGLLMIVQSVWYLGKIP
ncbi:hypothetical protein [Halobellus clavatus]|jgi:hypothetical protein|uniref:Uncharacterized protein n=1 Tax=Halobellus clavatus TaxID=660517 RepID=A0A1H3DP69_9EURY|nr:hypothetical protein [Halobellus clavatus]SDX68147.1 hypothetical protein SAMN04487946_101690 [Halobellus clavatus]